MDRTPSGDSSHTPAFRIAAALREGHGVGDAAFDCFLPPNLCAASERFWSPLAVISRAAQWLTELDVHSVVDIGAGVGKFCVAAALQTRCKFIGLEQRPRLALAARELAKLFNVEERVQFVTAALGQVVTPPAACYYLFSPFSENLLDSRECLDVDVELNYFRYLSDVARVERLLDSAPMGTYVMTYNGFGGGVPDDYEEVRIDRELPGTLRMACKSPYRPY